MRFGKIARAIAAAAVSLCCALPAAASAAVLTFEDLDRGVHEERPLTTYAGFEWQGATAIVRPWGTTKPIPSPAWKPSRRTAGCRSPRARGPFSIARGSNGSRGPPAAGGIARGAVEIPRFPEIASTQEVQEGVQEALDAILEADEGDDEGGPDTPGGVGGQGRGGELE